MLKEVKHLMDEYGDPRNNMAAKEFRRDFNAALRAVREECADIKVFHRVLSNWLDDDDAADAAHWLIRTIKGDKEAFEQFKIAAIRREGKGRKT